ncbi:hypothetical protein EBH_0007820 [Eimeria brunetti]|uniref:Uncharacterized protein n=1 Tax=Eimeria brunetti TaxID=51314 RepID=U6LY72_9EIME|nr:hypothetical protein EBH_0007820 [Eimeria brunetti]
MREKESNGSNGRIEATSQNDGGNPDVDSSFSNNSKGSSSSSSIRSRHERLRKACHNAEGRVALLPGKKTNEELKGSSSASKHQQKTAAAAAAGDAPRQL